MTPIKAPHMGESISEATVAVWRKKVGDAVAQDELLAELETEKINLEVLAPQAGVLTSILVEAGATVSVGQVMGEVDETASTAIAAPQAASVVSAPAAVVAAPVATVVAPQAPAMGPAVSKMVEEKGLNPAALTGTGKGGRLTKEDIMALEISSVEVASGAPARGAVVAVTDVHGVSGGEERQPTSRLRKTVARRLKEAQNTAAMLTTYNEVDMSAVMALRKKYKDAFKERHGVNLGFMSLFTKAVVEGLKKFPAVNAEFTDEEVIYKHDYNISVAVSTDRGLVVPVVRHADRLSLAGIEKAIADYAVKARDGKLMPDDLSGGSFTITNGGVFGSLMSMPILNMPQVGILGMHAIKDRPVVIEGQIVIRPMMYVALTYDHRMIDGREAVGFLVAVKDNLEDPTRFLLNL